MCSLHPIGFLLHYVYTATGQGATSLAVNALTVYTEGEEHDMSDWNPWPPPDHAGGHIDASTDAGDVTRPNLYHYADGRGSMWGYGVKVADKWTTVHPEYARWRWRGTLSTPEEQGSAILVWPWGDAPGELAALSDHGGDEDWVALLPATLAGAWIGWMESGTSFGCCCVSEHPLPDGRVCRIGAHA